jgi:hypothetical protein
MFKKVTLLLLATLAVQGAVIPAPARRGKSPVPFLFRNRSLT